MPIEGMERIHIPIEEMERTHIPIEEMERTYMPTEEMERTHMSQTLGDQWRCLVIILMTTSIKSAQS